MGPTIDVLLCTDYLPPSDGGVEHVVDQLARRLADRGHKVGIFTLATPEERLSTADHTGVSVFTARRIELTEYIGLQSAVSVDALREFGRVIDRFDPSIVHIHNRFFFTSVLAMLHSVRSDYELVTTLHLGELDHIDGVGGLVADGYQSTVASRLVGRSDAVICVSEAVESVARTLGAPAARTTVVRNSVDLDRFEVASSRFDKTLLYIGRLVRNNGPQDLLRAAPAIVDAHPSATIHVVGSGPLDTDLDAQAAALGVGDTVEFHGFVDDITDLYSIADVFCRPSYSEGLPLTLLESMATRTVPVVTPVAGSREVVTEGETGRFIDVEDPSGLADTVIDLFDRPEDVREMKEGARRYVEENLSWKRRTEKVITVYEDVLAG